MHSFSDNDDLPVT